MAGNGDDELPRPAKAARVLDARHSKHSSHEVPSKLRRQILHVTFAMFISAMLAARQGRGFLTFSSSHSL